MKKRIVIIVILINILSLFVSCVSNKKVHPSKNPKAKDTQVKDSIEKSEENEDIKAEEEKDKGLSNNNEAEYITLKPEEVYIPILMYHSISNDDPGNSLLVPIEMFDEQMKWLSDNGYTSMSLEEAINSMETGKVPKNPFVITFDDGYSDNYKSAFPILKNYNLKATFFVITSGVDDGYYMSSDMLKEMKAAGMEIENHTSNHLELDKLSKEDAYYSIKDGQDFLRNSLGVEANYLCYPVGKYNLETIDIQKELGIKAAVTTNEGRANISNGLHELNRIRVYPMTIEEFSSILGNY